MKGRCLAGSRSFLSLASRHSPAGTLCCAAHTGIPEENRLARLISRVGGSQKGYSDSYLPAFWYRVVLTTAQLLDDKFDTRMYRYKGISRCFLVPMLTCASAAIWHLNCFEFSKTHDSERDGMTKIVKEPFAPTRRHIGMGIFQVRWWRELFAVISLVFLKGQS